ncbi:DUF2637 domain-containing protein [Streptomyces sp. DW26H14]|uniref:DUF2637 domain-containing protein n=1 Tax=Streptomyces sp. DW26H14 TaxID=3435395 RepID=UPI00403DEACA
MTSTTIAGPRTEALPAPRDEAADTAAPQETPVPAGPPAAPARVARVMRLLGWVVMAAVVVVAIIGFYGSYGAVYRLALHHGLSHHFARLFPIGVDAGIGAFLGLDLVLLWRRAPLPLVRFVAYVLTASTVYFNARAARDGDVTGAIMHGVVPILFIVAVEAARHLILRAARLRDGVQREGVPLHRWVLAPWATAAMWRRMRLWEVPYAAAVTLEQEREVYRTLLDREFADAGGWKAAPSDRLLPFTLARYGLSVDEALARPQEAEAAERRRAAEAEQRAQQIAEQQTEAAHAAALREIARTGELETVRATTAADTDTARTVAEARRRDAERAVSEAERIADEEQEARESVRAAADRRRAAEETRAAQKAEAEAAEAARRTATANSRTARADAETAEDRQRLAVADRVAAEEKERAASARERAAVIEQRAVEAEDVARLTPRERGERRVARMILAEAGGDPWRLSLARIAEAEGVSESTAGERRTAAADLLAQGYAPQLALQ